MPIPDGWPPCLIRCVGKNLTADDWLAENFEHDTSTTINLIDNIRVSRLSHYKNAKGDWRHEFIVATLLDGRGHVTPDEPLYLKYERTWREEEDEKKKRRAKMETSRASSAVINQPIVKEDIVTPWGPSNIDKLKRAVEKGKMLLLREMTFPSNPTILDFAAVLEAHSTLSTEYRLLATMCYWYARSTYEVLKCIYNGRNEDSVHARKAGKLGIITGYRAIREKQDTQDVGSLVGLVKQQLCKGTADPIPPEELEQVAKAELERIPKFEALRQRSVERKDEVLGVLERRESERIKIESQGRELEEERARRAADQQKLEEERARWAADQQAMAREREEDQAELWRLREQLAALQQAGNNGK